MNLNEPNLKDTTSNIEKIDPHGYIPIGDVLASCIMWIIWPALFIYGLQIIFPLDVAPLSIKTWLAARVILSIIKNKEFN